MSGTWNVLAAETIERRLEFAHLPEGWAAFGSVVLLTLVLTGVILFYRAEQRSGASGRARAFLAVLRCAVISLLALIWLEPILAQYIHRTIESPTLLLVDGSASMNLRDRYPMAADADRVNEAIGPNSSVDATRLTRAQLVQTLLDGNGRELLQKMAVNNPIRLFQFGDRLVPVGYVTSDDHGTVFSAPTDEPVTQPASQPANKNTPHERTSWLSPANAPVTDISRAIRHAIESQAGAPVAAVVVFSDGRFNRGEPIEVVAQYARQKRIPIHVVGIGDPSLPKNVTVTAVEASPNVFVKDPFKVTAHLRAQGLDAGTLEVTLLDRDADTETLRTVQTKHVPVGPGCVIEPVVFSHQITEASERQLIIRCDPQEAETIVNDNQKKATVRALDNKMRVLVIAGGPSWEYRYLTRLLERDATMNLSCWLQSADEEAVREGNTIIDHFPKERQELLEYDCIVLLDPQPVDFDPAWAKHVEALVSEDGGGLLYVAGRPNAPLFAHDPQTVALRDLLPVVIDAGQADLFINELGHFQSAAWSPVIPAAVANHPVLALVDQPEENAALWARFPGVYWHYPVQRAKHVATVLLRHSNPRMRNTDGGHVLLATQFLGSGRTGYLAYNDTWRWRRFGNKYFNMFWIQLLRHLVEGKLLSGHKRGFIQLERDQYAIGKPVSVEARLVGAGGRPLGREQVEATVHLEGLEPRTITLATQPHRPGWYRGSFVPTEVGTHVVRIDLPGSDGQAAASIRAEVRVDQPNLEFRQTTLDRESLEVLALQSAGGRYLSINETDQLVSLIPNKTISLVLTGQPRPLWNRWYTLVAIVAFLGVEWAVRKAVHLL